MMSEVDRIIGTGTSIHAKRYLGRSGDGSLIRSVIRDKSYLIHTCHDRRIRGTGTFIRESEGQELLYALNCYLCSIT